VEVHLVELDQVEVHLVELDQVFFQKSRGSIMSRKSEGEKAAERLEALAAGDDEHAAKLNALEQTSSAAYYEKRAEWRRKLARDARDFEQLDKHDLSGKPEEMIEAGLEAIEAHEAGHSKKKKH